MKAEIILLGHPTYVSADLCFIGILLLFFLQLPAELAERNETKTDNMLGSECDLKMRVRNLEYLISYKSGAQKHLFDFTT